MTPDLINGIFEFGGACMLALNVRQLYRDKVFKGVHWGPVLFFASWGVWNLYYYPQLDQMWSFIGGLCIATMNTIWFSQMVYYTLRKRNDPIKPKS